MSKYLSLVCAILVVACASLWGINSNLRQEKERLSDNQDALMEEVQLYKTEAGKSAASVQMLELTKSELEAYNKELSGVIDDLNLKLKRVEAATTTATKTEIDIEVPVKDSITYRDPGRIEKLPIIKWSDSWVKVYGEFLKNDTLNLKIQSVDTLHQVVHRVPHEWWFFKWGTKAIRQEIRSSNPHTVIVYSEYIELEKGCRRKKK